MNPRVILVVLLCLCSLRFSDALVDPAVIESLKAFAAGFDYFPINWPLATVDPCEAPKAYSGTIICSDSKVTELRLGSQFEKIQGTLPSAVTGLVDLEVLDLYDNAIRGTIPDLSPLQNLDLIFLNRNQLSGTIPASLGELKNLTSLLLSFNQLTGTIPSALGDLENLQALYLSANKLSGGIPSSLSNLKELLVLGLHYNGLSSSIPPTLDELGNLVFMYLQYNHLVGQIPAFQGLSMLKVLHIGGNNITGSIPDFQNFENLRALVLGPNRLIGKISPTVGDSPLLEQFLAGGNNLTGDVPSSLTSLSGLTRLDLHWNKLNGDIPEFSKVPQFLLLSHNKFKEFPAWLKAAPPASDMVDLRNNSFICPLPSWCDSTGNGMCLPCKTKKPKSHSD